MRANEIFESYQSDVEQYAAQYGIEDISWTGSGDMGEAYITDKDTVLKATKDKTEIEYAKKIIGKNLENVVDVYDVQGNVIHMELLDTDGVEDMYYEAMQYSEYGDFDSIDPDEVPEDVQQFVNDINYGMYELQKNGVNNLDLKSDNIGRKSNGNYAIFDMSSAKANM